MKYVYHYPQENDDIKYSAFFEFNKSEKIIDFNKYLIFIKFDNKMYIDIKGLRWIIMPYDQFIDNKNEDLKKYYELSLKLSENNNYIIEKNCNGKDDWFFNCAYIVNDSETNIQRVEKGNYYCYCNINPFILKKINVSSEKNIKKYFNKLSILFLSEDNNNIESSSCIESSYCVDNIIYMIPYVDNIIAVFKKYLRTSYYDKIEKLITKYLTDLDIDANSD